MEKLTPQQQEQRRLKFSFLVVVALMLWGLAFNEITDSNIVELDAGSYIISGIIGLVTICVSACRPDHVNPHHHLTFRFTAVQA